MDSWTAVLWGVAAIAAIPSLYGLHRLCLWLESRGLLYYWHKRPGGSAAGCLTPWQEMMEPGMRHALHVKDERRRHEEGEGGGEGQPPEPKAD